MKVKLESSVFNNWDDNQLLSVVPCFIKRTEIYKILLFIIHVYGSVSGNPLVLYAPLVSLCHATARLCFPGSLAHSCGSHDGQHQTAITGHPGAILRCG